MDIQVIETSDGLRALCAWFGRCTNTTEHAAEHPILGPVPICSRCADKAEIAQSDLLSIQLTVGEK